MKTNTQMLFINSNDDDLFTTSILFCLAMFVDNFFHLMWSKRLNAATVYDDDVLNSLRNNKTTQINTYGELNDTPPS